MSFTPQIIELADGLKCVSLEDYKKLERERDEVREALADWENAAAHVEADHPDEKHCGCVPVLRKLLTDALMDRASGDIATMTINHYERILRERDEARAVAGELADVASKYLSFLLAVTPAKTNETHEKETMKVIDAIKRWKKL